MRSLLILLCFVVAVAFVAGAPPFVKGGFHPCTCVGLMGGFTDRRHCGPDYWCQDHETAQECDAFGAFDYCNRNGWD